MGVRAAVADEAGPASEELPVVPDGRLDLDDRGYPGSSGRELLLPGVGEADRRARLSRQQSRDGVEWLEGDLPAEGASHGRSDDPDLAQGYSEDIGQPLLQTRGVHGGGVRGELSVGVPKRHHAVGLQVALVDDLRFIPVLEDVVRLCEGPFHVPLADLDPDTDVPGGVVGQGVNRGADLLFVDSGRAFLQGLLGRKNGGELFPVDPDEVERPRRRLQILGRDGGHLVADEPDAIPGQNEVVLDQASQPDSRDVPPRHHGADPRQPFRLRGVQSRDARVRERTPQQQAVQHPRELDVRAVCGGARDLLAGVHARQRFADHAERVHSSPPPCLEGSSRPKASVTACSAMTRMISRL